MKTPPETGLLHLHRENSSIGTPARRSTLNLRATIASRSKWTEVRVGSENRVLQSRVCELTCQPDAPVSPASTLRHSPTRGRVVYAEIIGDLLHRLDAGPECPRHRLAPVGVPACKIRAGLSRRSAPAAWHFAKQTVPGTPGPFRPSCVSDNDQLEGRGDSRRSFLAEHPSRSDCYASFGELLFASMSHRSATERQCASVSRST